MKLVKFMIKKGADNNGLIDWNGYLCDTCEDGHLELAKLIIKKGGADIKFNWNRGFRNACKNGHIELVKLMFENNVDNQELLDCFEDACEGEIKDFISYGIKLNKID